mmetsp:Transcript_162139/g.519963  ORF Transcript_162139/g.519963 Transcript_162139/m.519963 type:complete len:275 (+) Transcript_162139:1179-2003(+)
MPLLGALLTDALRATRSREISTKPPVAAAASGVTPPALATLTSACLLQRICTISKCPREAAAMSGAGPSLTPGGSNFACARRRSLTTSTWPSKAEADKAVTPSRRGALMLMPTLSPKRPPSPPPFQEHKIVTTDTCPFAAAVSKGVSPSCVGEPRSAPATINSRTMLAWPCAEATNNGDLPSPSARSTPALTASRNCTTSGCPASDAWNKAVRLVENLPSTSARASHKERTASTSPVLAASTNGKLPLVHGCSPSEATLMGNESERPTQEMPCA